MTGIIRQSLGPAAAVFGVGYMGYMLMPAQLTTLIERFDLSEGRAGFAATLQLGALALFLFLSVRALNKYSGKSLALTGCTVAVAGYLGSGFGPNYGFVQFALIVAGAGMGMTLAGGNAIISSMKQPDRVYAASLAAGQLAAALLLIFVVPSAIKALGLHGPYIVLSLWTAIMFFLIATIKTVKTKEMASDEEPSLLVYLSLPVLALFLIGFSDASVWPFTGEIGSKLGLDAGQAEAVQGFALLAGILGATVASIVGTRFGRIKPLCIGAIFAGVLYFSILNAPSATIYSGAQILVLFFFGFSVPYFFGICAALDPKGRIMAAAAGMQMVGLALAPSIAGVIMGKAGPFALGSLVLVSFLMALTFGLKGAKKLDRGL